MRKFSWKQIEEIVAKLSDKIKSSGFKPDYMIGITTGGLIPLALLSKELNIKNILTASALTLGSGKEKKVSVTYLPEINLAGKKVLVVDEIAETGLSLKRIKEAIAEKYNVSEIRTATLGVNKDHSSFWPDYYEIIEEGDWVKFPWEKEKFSKYVK
ncbi:MAG: Phosphoribosyltransferase [Candidatus Gottesmanbacteria bacterium GW2011_GWC2_39_8]|uniref:Phosphoribosyltransferase n=1 Tax=Candidatus Gottesmanbacteria bacterium GW2011_GWC2_39_8 TaxID=1618450 RepID=A0A0G0SEL8_9BACT|nr:MAG: Phosphoribosyltransferase [Candidatus Gottesmanbacteria bacterium GW2011_GWC2_39_8]